jgi:uroporphyrinogen-III decarboxylase
MMDLAEEEPYPDDLLPMLHEPQKRFAQAQIAAGADIIGVGNSVASLVGPALYEQYGLPWDKAIVEYIHSLGAKVKLHICGNITAILPLIKQVEADILDVDWMVDFAAAAKFFDGSATAVSGNMDPVRVMMLGSPADVEKQVNACISATVNTTLIAGGCEIPAATPDGNLLLMDKLLYR